jgi:hypothetical protein
LPIRLSLIVSLCPLLAGCLGGGGDEGAADSTTNDPTVADDTSSTTAGTDPPLETETDNPPPETETDTAADTDAETETETAPPETDTDIGEPVAGCECILDEEPVDSCAWPTDPTCGEAICPPVSAACADGLCSDALFELDDPAALECALTALRDRTPGLLTWSYSEELELLTQDGYLLIHDDGTAVRRDATRQDFNVEVSDATLGELLPETFDACLADPSDLARFDCMRGAFETQLGVCDAGWNGPDCI